MNNFKKLLEKFDVEKRVKDMLDQTGIIDSQIMEIKVSLAGSKIRVSPILEKPYLKYLERSGEEDAPWKVLNDAAIELLNHLNIVFPNAFKKKPKEAWVVGDVNKIKSKGEWEF